MRSLEEAVDGESGSTPDLLSSPEVLTWRRMLRGVSRVEGTFLWRAVAALMDETVCME